MATEENLQRVMTSSLSSPFAPLVASKSAHFIAGFAAPKERVAIKQSPFQRGIAVAFVRGAIVYYCCFLFFSLYSDSEVVKRNKEE